MLNKKSLYKTITWRIIDSLFTFLVVLFITKEPLTAGLILVVVGIGEMILYYIHERVWSKVKLNDKKTNKKI